MNLTPLTQRGFTLTEIAVTLAIVGSILAAIAVPLAGRWEANQVADTERSLELILDALIGLRSRMDGSLARPTQAIELATKPALNLGKPPVAAPRALRVRAILPPVRCRGRRSAYRRPMPGAIASSIR